MKRRIGMLGISVLLTLPTGCGEEDTQDAASGGVANSGGRATSPGGGGATSGNGGMTADPASGGSVSGTAAGGALSGGSGGADAGNAGTSQGGAVAGSGGATGGSSGGASAGTSGAGGAAAGTGGSGGSGAKKVLFIGATPGEENASWDDAIIPKLATWGYPVDKKYTRADLLAFTEASYAGYDFIFLSETLDSRVPGMAKLRDIPLPMVNSDGYGAKEAVFAFGGSQGILEELVSVVFLAGAAGHPLGAGYSPGTVVEFGSRGIQECLSIWGTPTMETVKIAGLQSNPEMLMIYGSEKGTLNAAGEAIKHRVATIGIHAWCYDNLTEAGEKVFKAGIEWVLAEAP